MTIEKCNEKVEVIFIENLWYYEPLFFEEDSFVFHKALRCYKDPYFYYPLAVSKTLQCGAKYRFLCIAYSELSERKSSHFACIEIYQPLQGKPYVTRVHKMNFDPVY